MRLVYVKSIILFCASLCAGCVHQSSAVHAYDGVSVSFPAVSQTLANDAAERLALAFAPGKTTLAVNADSQFGKELEAALRRHGFSIAPHGMTVGYSLDLLRDEATPTCYLRLSLPEGNFSQMYSLQSGFPEAIGQMVKSAGLPDFDPSLAQVRDMNVEPTPEPIREASEVLIAQQTPEIKVRASAKAKDVAKRNRVAVGDFCRWNGVEPQTMLAAGRGVYLKEPGFNVLPAAGLPAPPAPSAPPTMLSAAELPSAAQIAPTPITPVMESWDIQPGMLRPQLERWSELAGYQLIWKARHDFEMHSQAAFMGDFNEAIKRLFSGMHQQGNPLRTTIYQDNNVLEVSEE